MVNAASPAALDPLTCEGVWNVTAPFMWFDLASADPGKTAGFYGDLFGWSIADAGVGGYRSFIGGAQPWAGITASDDAGQWLPYVVVDDLDQAAKQAVALGATVLAGPTEGPAGTSVRIADPGGAQLALFKPFSAAP
ncbi:glyoxalase [Rhizocola hellebori]|uniref:Glyoxalase n=1 Tax=Rhizocola hellebori TaxID=1392758 RepID=A0A8J3VGV3_9ACTN|nr:VOC family protein [Rhizocola hellebori]GIH05263.1 glyoxalase [Rhizocola hellebori]